ncbi:hypothetical protein SAMN04488500_103244 [Sporomusa malonica]|uniref:Uncharacterized protein n=1 Tax=Sporomusa malonica TaxID=112901 RepID=A0A1W1ZFM1_9FIRM|nr:hypothetical protein SAMN04488500_103244 [Sporomusa malonica]
MEIVKESTTQERAVDSFFMRVYLTIEIVLKLKVNSLAFTSH